MTDDKLSKIEAQIKKLQKKQSDLIKKEEQKILNFLKSKKAFKYDTLILKGCIREALDKLKSADNAELQRLKDIGINE